MASMVSSVPHLRSGTVVARDCMSATGSEFEFMNMDAAVAKFLRGGQETHADGHTDVHLRSAQTACAREPVCEECRETGEDDKEDGDDP
jgi:hypothetical protein